MSEALFAVAALPRCPRCGPLSYGEVQPGPACGNCGGPVRLVREEPRGRWGVPR
jgi:ribosomal protein L37E